MLKCMETTLNVCLTPKCDYVLTYGWTEYLQYVDLTASLQVKIITQSPEKASRCLTRSMFIVGKLSEALEEMNPKLTA